MLCLCFGVLLIFAHHNARKFAIDGRYPTGPMIRDAFFLPPFIELGIALAETVKNIVISGNAVRGHFFDEGEQNFLRLEGRAEPGSRIVNRENAISEGRLAAPCTVV